MTASMSQCKIMQISRNKFTASSARRITNSESRITYCRRTFLKHCLGKLNKFWRTVSLSCESSLDDCGVVLGFRLVNFRFELLHLDSVEDVEVEVEAEVEVEVGVGVEE